MELIGKTTINPVLFYSGKTCGYITLTAFILSACNVIDISAESSVSFRIASLFTFSAGLILTIFSLISLGGSTRIGLPTGKTSLKTEGIYKISRHLQYICISLDHIRRRDIS